MRTLPVLTLASLATLASTARADYLLVDSFETSNSWTKFEEPVAGNVCANPTLEVASVDRVAMPPELGGGHALEVFANAAGSLHASHAIAQQHLLDVGPYGTWTFSTLVWIDATEIGLTQTGPELSLQATRPIGLDESFHSRWRTLTAGIQYVGNQWSQAGGIAWRVWGVDNQQTSPEPDSEVASWRNVSSPYRLHRTGWYEIELTVDYTSGAYAGLSIRYEDDAAPTQIPVAGAPLARELKWSEGAFWATLEAESLYDCNPSTHVQNAVWQNAVYYDDVRIEQTSGAIHAAPESDNLYLSGYAGDTFELDVADLATDLDGDLDAATLRVLQGPSRGDAEVDTIEGTLTYTATAPGGDSVKFAVCDETFLCTEAWIDFSTPNRAPYAPEPVIHLVRTAGTQVELAFPVVDLDGPLASSVVDWHNGYAQTAASAGVLAITGPEGQPGQAAVHVKGCDAAPWSWCAGAWVVIDFVN